MRQRFFAGSPASASTGDAGVASGGGPTLGADTSPASRAAGAPAGPPWAVLAGSVAILAAAMLPYLTARRLQAPGAHFWGGIWYSPDDSLLLSVMQEGWNGSWVHVPPYGSVHGPGAFFYPEYLLLGHLCRWLRLPLVDGFHLGRLGAGIVLLWSLWRFVSRFFERAEDRRFAFFVASTGAGIGWLLLRFFRFRPAELGASEAYPFFSGLTSLHLTLSIAALLWVMDAIAPRRYPPAGGRDGKPWSRWVWLAAGTILLATMQPFGCVVALVALALLALSRAAGERRFPREETIAGAVMVALMLPFVAHQLLTIARNPAYIGWRMQVRTPTPPLWEALCALGLPLPFAVLGIVQAARRRDAGDRLLLAWVAAAVVLLALPYYQSRRFDLGVYVPLAILAVRGIRGMGWDWRGDVKVLATTANAIGSLLLVAVCVSRIQNRDPELFLSDGTWRSVGYLRQHASDRPVVLAGWYTSLGLLASAPVRVVYGHPAETPDSERASRALRAFFAGGPMPPETLAGRVDYILVEGADGSRVQVPAAYRPALRAGSTVLYRRAGTAELRPGMGPVSDPGPGS